MWNETAHVKEGGKFQKSFGVNEIGALCDFAIILYYVYLILNWLEIIKQHRMPSSLKIDSINSILNYCRY